MSRVDLKEVWWNVLQDVLDLTFNKHFFKIGVSNSSICDACLEYEEDSYNFNSQFNFISTEELLFLLNYTYLSKQQNALMLIILNTQGKGWTMGPRLAYVLGPENGLL